MTVRRLGSRLARVEATERARIDALHSGPVMLLVYPDAWPPAYLQVFDGKAAGARAEVVARQTGVRPGPATRILAVRVRRNGPA